MQGSLCACGIDLRDPWVEDTPYATEWNLQVSLPSTAVQAQLRKGKAQASYQVGSGNLDAHESTVGKMPC